MRLGHAMALVASRCSIPATSRGSRRGQPKYCRQSSPSADTAAVNAQQKRVNALQEVYQCVGGRVIPGIKAATALLGRSTPFMRQRSMSLDQAEIAKVRGVLTGLGLLA